MNGITIENILLRLMPFSPGLLKWCKDNQDFTEALKIIYTQKFIALGAAVITSSPLIPEDKVIGFFVYDYKSKSKKFKQDFIVDKDAQDEVFKLYTSWPGRQSGKNVQHINDFYARYGGGTYYVDTHHLSLDQLPLEVQPRGIQAINLAKKIERTGLRDLTQDDLDDFDDKLRKLGR